MTSGVRPMESGKCPVVVRICLLDRGIVRLFIGQVRLGLNANVMTESSIKTGHRSVYNTFLNYLDENEINEVSEDICIQYIESRTQVRLPSLLTVTRDASLNRRIRALVILLRYQETGSLDLRTRGINTPFSCPEALAPAYEAFVKDDLSEYLNKSSYMRWIIIQEKHQTSRIHQFLPSLS